MEVIQFEFTLNRESTKNRWVAFLLLLFTC
uniref:Uncharacterized protein n=1 Tax=Tetranychus urticae TaxID=32264 RepID=T1JS72_TETUR